MLRQSKVLRGQMNVSIDCKCVVTVACHIIKSCFFLSLGTFIIDMSNNDRQFILGRHIL